MALPLRIPSILASTLAIAAFSGCGGDETTTSTGAGGTTTTTAATGGAGGSGGSGGSGGAGGGALPQNYKPAGCAFEIAPRAEYLDWSVGQTTTQPTPAIRRVRLGLGGNITAGPGRADPATSAGFAWQTDDGTLASEVTWGSSPDPATWPAANRTSGATWLTPQGLIQPNGDARMHEVHICGLTPATTYYYRVGGGPAGGEVWSDVHSFTTTPPAGDTPVTIAINGDARGQNGGAWRLYQRKLLSKGVTLQLFSGDAIDLALDQGEWEEWLDLAERDDDGSLLTLGQVLNLQTNGNHDNRSTLFHGNLVLPQDVKNNPTLAELFYSVDVGPVHVVVIDDSFFASTLVTDEDKATTTAWLAADLAAANQNRATVPWILTMHHRGPFSSSSHGEDKDVHRTRAAFMPLFDEHHVDMDIAGHDHNYERTKPLSGDPVTPTLHESPKDGTVYLLCAGAGAPAYSPGTSDFTAISKGYKTGGAIGVYAYLTATKTELTLESHELRPDGTDPVFDTYTITK